MANEEHLSILKQGVEVWNRWRKDHLDTEPDFVGASLFDADFNGANFHRASFNNANLGRTSFTNANLIQADFSGANLSQANLSHTRLSEAILIDTELNGTNLNGANLTGADLSGANLSSANLIESNFNRAEIGWTIFGNVDLSAVKGLSMVKHLGPSTIGLDTIYVSHGNIPEAFLKGAGVDDTFIEYMHSLISKPIDYYSCFISFSSKDADFAQHLYADLQSNNIRCWFAPEHLKIGDKFRHRIDESIRVYDKLLLVLSEASLTSTWVGYEVEKALDKEPEGKPNVLFPIRLDKAILTCETDWAKDIRSSRHIGDFEHWKDHGAYQIAFERLLRDLKAQS